MRLAIADPPYPPHIGVGGLTPRASRWYGDKAHTLGRGCYPADYNPSAGEWDEPARHRELIEYLVAEFDGFAIATSADGVDAYAPLPNAAKRLVWVKPNATPGPSRLHSKWESVILYPPAGRRSSRGGVGCVPDVMVEDFPEVLIESKRNDGFAGSKPERWTHWVLDAMSYDPATDEVVDIFGGSGSVARAIATYQQSLGLWQ